MNTTIKYLSSNLTNQNALLIRNELMKRIQEDKIYLDGALSLRSTADLLQTNTKYLSQVINQSFACNFQIFINRYRILEFQQRMINGETKLLTYYGLARECGFSNRSTFYRAFKFFTALTPKEFYAQSQAA